MSVMDCIGRVAVVLSIVGAFIILVLASRRMK